MNHSCEYDTEDPQESRSQAVRRRYEDLHALQQNAGDSLQWLRSQTADTIASCLQQLERAEDPLRELCTVVAAERAKRRSPGIPEQEVLIASSSIIKDTLTAELVFRYPASFPWPPEVVRSPPSKRQKRPDRLSRPRQSSSASGTSTTLPGIHSTRVGISKRSEVSGPSACSVRLRDLDLSFWTTVPIFNELASSIISLYLEIEHPVYGFFDAELFLEDLLAHRTVHCSPLLVNSVLFWASCTFGPIYPEAQKLASAFLKAAQRLLHGERTVNHCLNVAALNILAISTICFGKDVLARDYMVDGIRMAEDLFLVGKRRQGLTHFSGMDRDSLSMFSYVAWGTFNWSSVYLLHFHDAQGPTYTKFPPLLPKPISKAVPSETQLHEESSLPLSVNVPDTFHHFCDFWRIAHEIGSVLYSAAGPVYQYVPLAFAESKFVRLLEWAEGLPAEAARSESMPHNVAEMHICYHATIMDLFRPFLAKGQVLSAFSSSPRRPEAIFGLSLSHLRALTRYYHTTYAGHPASHTISWVHGPLYVAPAILHYERRLGWQADFFANIEACTDLLRSHQVMEGFLRALLGMAVLAEGMTVVQATEYLDSLRATRDMGYYGGIPETGFVIDQDLAVESREAAKGDVLVQRFDEMLFLEDPIGFR